LPSCFWPASIATRRSHSLRLTSPASTLAARNHSVWSGVARNPGRSVKSSNWLWGLPFPMGTLLPAALAGGKFGCFNGTPWVAYWYTQNPMSVGCCVPTIRR
jgi:hypothetical protein